MIIGYGILRPTEKALELELVCCRVRLLAYAPKDVPPLSQKSTCWLMIYIAFMWGVEDMIFFFFRIWRLHIFPLSEDHFQTSTELCFISFLVISAQTVMIDDNVMWTRQWWCQVAKKCNWKKAASAMRKTLWGHGPLTLQLSVQIYISWTTLVLMVIFEENTYK